MIGQTVSHYQIVELLGTGGMGVVYHAVDTHLGRHVAIKLLTASSDPQYRARFKREGRAVSLLSHPNIATVYDYGETPSGQPFIVMELVKGETLGQLLERSALSLGRAVEIVGEVAAALGEAHEHKIVHRDVKPSNVIVNERGRVKVLDFGLVKDLKEDVEEHPGTRTRSDVMVGTPLYLSPEQATSGAVDGRSDLFALGAVLYECITGQSAFSGSTLIEIGAQVIHFDPPVPSTINPRIPAELDRITMKALAKKPAQRYQTAAEMIADLQAVGATLGVAGPRITRISQPSVTHPSAMMKLSDTLRRPRLSLGVLVIAVVVGAIIIWVVPRLMRGTAHQPTADAQVWYKHGSEALRAGAYQQAAKALEKATAADPKFGLAHARLAEALLEQDYADRGRQELLVAKQFLPDYSVLSKSDALYMDGISAIGVQDYATAIGAYRQIASESDAQPQAYLDLGRALEKNEQIDDAIKSYVQAAARDSNYAPAYLRAGILYQRKGQMATARESYDKAESLFQSMGLVEGQTEVLLNRGSLLREDSKFDEARAQLRRAYDLAEANQSELQKINALIELGRVSYAEGDTEQAETYQKQAVEFAQQSRLETPAVRGLITLGNTVLLKGNYEEVQKNYFRALEIARRNKSGYLEALCLLNLATLRNKQLRSDEALQFAEQALKIFQAGNYRNNVMVCLSAIGRARRRKGDYEGARKAFDERLGLAQSAGNERQIASSYADLAMVLFELDRFPEAVKTFEQSYEIYERLGDRINEAYNLMNRGNALWRLGDFTQAEGVLQKAETLASKKPEGELKPVLVEVELIRAQMALSLGRWDEARRRAKNVLAESVYKGEGVPIQARYTLGLAQSSSGTRTEGKAPCNEALNLAKDAGDAALLSRALLALAETELLTGSAAEALPHAREAEQRFSGAGQKESAWRALVVVARASQTLHDDEGAQQTRSKASALLSELRQNWGDEAYNLYLNRPDIQNCQKQLGGQTVASKGSPTTH